MWFPRLGEDELRIFMETAARDAPLHMVDGREKCWRIFLTRPTQFSEIKIHKFCSVNFESYPTNNVVGKLLSTARRIVCINVGHDNCQSHALICIVMGICQ